MLDAAAKKSDWTTEELIDIAAQIGDGLRSAHDADIVHRDLKPANILIDKEGRARILDFGIAKVKGAAKLTKTGSTMGTVSYLSPEQAQGRDVDQRSDLFSLGAILYELITGHQPFGGEHEAAIVYAIANEVPEPLARYKKDVPDELQRIVSKCMAKDPRERYQSAVELVADLRSLKRQQATGTIPTAPPKQKSRLPLVAMLIIVAGAAVAIVPRLFDSGPASPDGDTIMLAVLPFENMGSPEDEYFASGITEEILTNLSKVPGLGVISRTSTLKYKDRTQSVKEIGKELGVEYVLEASIQWDKSSEVSRIRLHPQLIRTSDDTHVWAHRYTAVLDDIFEVQSTIASEVSGALSLALLPDQAQQAGIAPTDNSRAYELYLKAKGYALAGLGDHTAFPKAIQSYREAIALDSTFALARAGLSMALSNEAFGGSDLDPSNSQEALTQAQMALELSPGLPQGHIALGQYYALSAMEYDKALEQFTKVRNSGVEESEVLRQIGIVHLRQGKWLEALADLEQSLHLDPLSKAVCSKLVDLNQMIRRYDDALRYCDRLISLDPDDVAGYRWKIEILTTHPEQLAKAKETYLEASQFVDSTRLLSELGWIVVQFEFTDHTLGDIRQALDQDTRLRQDTVFFHLEMSDILELMGDSAGSKSHADSALEVVRRDLALLQGQKGMKDPLALAHLQLAMARALAKLKQYDEAIRYAEMSVETLPIDECHW
jgi:serine/threonine-protein kinase